MALCSTCMRDIPLLQKPLKNYGLLEIYILGHFKSRSQNIVLIARVSGFRGSSMRNGKTQIQQIAVALN